MRVFACLLSRLFYNMRACFYDENRGRREDKKGVTRGKAGKKKRFFPARAKVLRFFLSDLFLERVSLSLSLSLSLSDAAQNIVWLLILVFVVWTAVV